MRWALTFWFAFVALLIALGRTFIDWSFVYPELSLTDPLAVAATLLFYVAIFAAWIWALVAIVRGRRVGLWLALGLTLLLNVGLGLGTTVAFCPTPCPTVWPVAELWNWATTISGLAASLALARAIRA